MLNDTQCRLEAVPLDDAVLCADCELITRGAAGQCVICGSRALLSLAGLLRGPLRQGESTEDPIFDPLVRELIAVTGCGTT